MGPLGLREAQSLKHQEDAFLDRQLPKSRGFLGQVTYALSRPQVHWQPRNILRIQKGLSGIWAFESDDHVENRRLARAIRPQKSYDLILMNIQRPVVDDDSLAV